MKIKDRTVDVQNEENMRRKMMLRWAGETEKRTSKSGMSRKSADTRRLLELRGLLEY